MMLLSHYLGNYQLIYQRILSAKAHGQRLLPMLEHAWVHVTLLPIVLFIFGVS